MSLAAAGLHRVQFARACRQSLSFFDVKLSQVEFGRVCKKTRSRFLFEQYFARRLCSTVVINHSQKTDPEFKQILSDDACEFLSQLHLKFNDRRKELLELRLKKKEDLRTGSKLSFLENTRHIREDRTWKIGTLPPALLKRHVEITGPVDRKMVVNALNSGADCFMADFEDSNSPTFANQINGQINLRDAINRTIDFELKGKQYKLTDKPAVLLVRPRGWHLPEKHLLVNGENMSGSLVDFGLYLFHNAKKLLESKQGPYFYLPKMENHLEARLWNEVFKFSQDYLSIQQGTIKATCLIETLPAVFEMDEILYELREHSAGLNAGRWDYIFSCIKTYQSDPDFILADRSLITMESPFMRAYALQLIRTCHQRDAPAIGGMSALIPIKNDPVANEKALNGVRLDKRRDARDGFDGGWVAHPGLQLIAREEFASVMASKSNQIDVKREDVPFDEASLLDFKPRSPITMNGLRVNCSVAIQYLGSWLSGNGCVPINNLMEDAATAEISRAQVWNWIQSKNGRLEDGQKVTKQLVQQVLKEELAKIEQNNANKLPYKKAAEIFEQMATKDQLEDFLTISLYKHF